MDSVWVRECSADMRWIILLETQVFSKQQQHKGHTRVANSMNLNVDGAANGRWRSLGADLRAIPGFCLVP